jgi:hypothetical protein
MSRSKSVAPKRTSPEERTGLVLAEGAAMVLVDRAVVGPPNVPSGVPVGVGLTALVVLDVVMPIVLEDGCSGVCFTTRSLRPGVTWPSLRFNALLIGRGFTTTPLVVGGLIGRFNALLIGRGFTTVRHL